MNLAEYIESHRDAHLEELFEFLRIPSISTQSEHKQDIERAAKWVAEKLRGSGMEKIEIVPTPMHPLVYGESLDVPGSPPCATATSMRGALPTIRARCTSTSRRWKRCAIPRGSCPST